MRINTNVASASSSNAMSRNTSTAATKGRPPAFSNKSFTRFEPSSPNRPPTHRHRASTVQSPLPSAKLQEEERKDVFNKFDPERTDEAASPMISSTSTLPDNFDELPIELASLTDRFIESLSTKAFEQPPSIDQIAELFQEFYIRASTSISIHISSLITRLNREVSPAPSRRTTKPRTVSAKSSDDSLLTPSTAEGAQQMLTVLEVTEKKRARKLLEYKRLLLEEAVERRACEKVYHKLWRHKSTLDEVRDEKLRSKTAALALVGIGLKDLGIELDKTGDRTTEDVQELLVPARDELMMMNDEKCPLAKLQHLTTAHKTIVDTLFSIQGSSSSADEILPTLIYTLITSPIEGMNTISNLSFIQRFRRISKVDGEAAYCMTNLEAAISFLENVDLASLRADEHPEGPRKIPSQPDAPIIEKPETDMMAPSPSSPTSTTATSAATASGTTSLKPKTASSKVPTPPAGARHQRTLSDIFQPIANAKDDVQNKAKEGFENLSNTLDNSFKFLFGRMKEQAADPMSPKDIIVPKTLDEAMQLVSKSPGPEDEAAAFSETSSVAEGHPAVSPTVDRTRGEDRVMALFGGRRPGSVREHSVDSQKSNTSSRHATAAALVNTGANTDNKQRRPSSTAPNQNSATTPLDQVRNLGSSLNPLSNIGNAFGGAFRGFGRPAMPTAANIAPPSPGLETKTSQLDHSKDGVQDLQLQLDDPVGVAANIRAVAPALTKFTDMSNPADLKIGDVGELLMDYKRLAQVLHDLTRVDPSANGSNK